MEQKGEVHTEKPAMKTRCYNFIKFVDEETELVKNALYSQQAVDQHTKRQEKERASARGIDDSSHLLFN